MNEHTYTGTLLVHNYFSELGFHHFVLDLDTNSETTTDTGLFTVDLSNKEFDKIFGDTQPYVEGRYSFTEVISDKGFSNIKQVVDLDPSIVWIPLDEMAPETRRVLKNDLQDVSPISDENKLLQVKIDEFSNDDKLYQEWRSETEFLDAFRTKHADYDWTNDEILAIKNFKEVIANKSNVQ